MDMESGNPQIKVELSKLTDSITGIKNKLSEDLTSESPNTPDIKDISDNNLKKLIEFSEDVYETNTKGEKKQTNPVVNKQLEFIVNAIDNIYPVRVGKVFESSTKRELYTYYKFIRDNIKKYINDLSSDVTSSFYQLLKDDKKNDFSKLGKNGFDMKTFYIDPNSKTASKRPTKPKKTKKIGGGFGNIFSSKSPVDTKIQQKLLTKLFVATSKDGKKLNDIQVAKAKEAKKNISEGEEKTSEGEEKTSEGEEKKSEGEEKKSEGEEKKSEGEEKKSEGEEKLSISSKFTEILNVVIPDIAAIIYYGYKLDYNNSILYKTNKTTTSASNALSTGVTTIGSSVYHAPTNLWSRLRGKKEKVGGAPNKNGNGKTRFKTPEWLCKPDNVPGNVPDTCNKDFINFLIGILLNPNYNPNINSNNTSYDKIFSGVVFTETITDKPVRIMVMELKTKKIDIVKFSNIFLYNIWLLIIFKFILNQGYLDDDLILYSHLQDTKRLPIKDNGGNIHPISTPTLGTYITETIKYIKELDKTYPMLETEEKEDDKEEGEEEEEEEEDEEEEGHGEEEDDGNGGDEDEEGEKERESLDKIKGRMSDGGGRKHSSKKRKPLITLKKRYKKSRKQTKKNKKSCKQTKKLKKKFRK
jgi:hypothetical protein